jgi:hypothetical protein
MRYDNGRVFKLRGFQSQSVYPRRSVYPKSFAPPRDNLQRDNRNRRDTRRPAGIVGTRGGPAEIKSLHGGNQKPPWKSKASIGRHVTKVGLI